ncbi:uncharacterized protein RSE6_00844 [Rhynchosporium secalis]|uniref:AAA+ ATPase domain-containing protein n=1 Tax=Rhynchosporium secalis TaxID=38038 RepID=A0A1E1LWB0_RHYSE|nr:uncharacterized protein RSE6_00844 [Rhynchosporium secalis]
MDPLAASIGVTKLISDIDKQRFQNIEASNAARVHLGDIYTIGRGFYGEQTSQARTSRDLELERLARQVIREIEDSEVYISILQEVQSLFDASSEDFPSSIKAALSSCISHQSVLDDCRQELMITEEKKSVSKTELKEYQKSFLEASQAFRRSVLLFRQLIIGSRADTYINVISTGDHNYGTINSPKEGEIVIGDVRIQPQQSSNVYVNNSINGNINNSAIVEQQVIPATNTSMGKTRDVVERSGLLAFIRDFEGTPMIMEDASDNRHIADKVITLTWYRNEESMSRMTDFFLVKTGPFDMLLGKEFIDDEFSTHFPEAYTQYHREDQGTEDPQTLLQARLRPMTPVEAAQYEVDKKAKRVADDKAEAQRREEKARKLRERPSRTMPTDQFLDILKSRGTNQELPPLIAAADKVEAKELRARDSTLEFKKVNEVYDKKEYKYKVVESFTPADEANELDHYIFVARTRLDIKSSGLRDILRKVFRDVQGVCLQEEKPSVEQKLLYHFILKLEEYRQSPSLNLDGSALEHLDLLLGFIRTAYASTTERLIPLLKKHQITYDLLWTLFKPNALAHTKCFGTSQLRCVSEERMRADLTISGRKFLTMMGVHFYEYEGKAFYIEKGQIIELFIKSQVVVDAAYFREENPNYARPSIKNSDKGSAASWDLIGLDITKEVSASAKDSAIDPSEVPLDVLYIPLRKKKAVQALSEAYVKRAMAYSFNNIVVGKGQGFSVLLHGLPSIRKTLTAELITEHLRRPLMPVSASELGTTAETVEMQLPRIFKRASRWKAVLLLDEADVLLEQRLSHDIHRNALVCVFLRTLEYYPGIIFLTTNRVEQIDNAIASRIHFKLKYDKLNLA